MMNHRRSILPSFRMNSRILFLPFMMFVLVLTCYNSHRVMAQGPETPVPGADIKSIFDEKETANQFPSITGTELSPVERRVNPEQYYVGPNDYLVITTNILTFPAVVGFDNQLVLPRGLQPLDVDGLTLAEVSDTLENIFRNRTSEYGTVRVSLQKPRSIYVTVGGNIVVPGRYLLTSADRVTTAVDLANRVPEELASIDKQLLEISKQRVLGGNSQNSIGNVGLGSTSNGIIRRVIVRHADGSSSEADLIRYQAFGEDKDNPTLREGDQIIVEFPDLFAASISIVGAVNNPIVAIRYREEDNIPFLLNLAAGLREDAAPEQAYIVRIGATEEERIPVDLSDSGTMVSFLLAPGDQIIVPSREKLRIGKNGIVTIRGEVVIPQTYSIVPGETRLSQVIEKAGGFTPFASLNGSYIRRLEDPLALRPQRQILDPIAGITTSSLHLEDTLRYVADRQMQQNLVSADFVAIFKHGDRSKDVILQHGDEISIPREREQVYVSGRIKHPGWVTYVPGENYDYYIEKAGGYTKAAAPERVEIEKYGTGVWDGVDAAIEPGDHIYVPGKRDTPARTALEQAGTILFIISGALGIVSSVINIINIISP